MAKKKKIVCICDKLKRGQTVEAKNCRCEMVTPTNGSTSKQIAAKIDVVVGERK